MSKFFQQAMVITGIVTTGYLLVIGGSYTVDILIDQYDAIQQENLCVSQYINSGYERSELIVGHGTCSAK